MTKAELTKLVAGMAEVSQKKAAAVLDAFFNAVEMAAVRGDEVRIPGFGSFVVRERAARKGRDIRTGEEIVIPAHKVLIFKPSKALKEAVS